jgi:calcineurin-like phosphoesterase family protein
MNKKYLHKLSRINGRKTLVMGNHDPLDITLYSGLVEKIAGALAINDYIVTHIPVHERQVSERFAANIHGHLHGHPVLTRFDTIDRRYFNVSVESLNYIPISLEEIKKTLE